MNAMQSNTGWLNIRLIVEKESFCKLYIFQLCYVENFHQELQNFKRSGFNIKKFFYFEVKPFSKIDSSLGTTNIVENIINIIDETDPIK